VFGLFSVNAALAAYNLTPVPFSDGGGILRCVLGAFLGERIGGGMCSVLELVFSFAFFVFFSYRFFALGTGFFPFFCSFVFVMVSIQAFYVE
jgi:Zn-dependent protease